MLQVDVTLNTKIFTRMRPGYKAAVRVWRQKAMRDMVIEVTAPAR